MAHHSVGPEAEETFLKLIEECMEVGHATAKLMQHGPFSYNPDVSPNMSQSNRMALSAEMGDLLGVIKWMFENGMVDPYVLQERARTKMQRVARYAHHIKVPAGYVPRDI